MDVHIGVTVRTKSPSTALFTFFSFIEGGLNPKKAFREGM